MARLLVFNPDHDYALAADNPYYMAPAKICNLARKLQLIPLIWAKEDDLVLLADDKILACGNKYFGDISNIDIAKIEPWGWDKPLCRRLKKIGFGESFLPSNDNIENLRRLSHRRISIDCNRFLDSPLIPQELTTLEEAMDFYNSHHFCYFKMPWSSGGRGVVATHELSPIQVEEWVGGCIKKQGSVMGEKSVERVLDFATLWNVDDTGYVTFEGYSVSLSDGRGKYDGNLYGSQKMLENHIFQKAPGFNKNILDKQKEYLEKSVAPYYYGKLGIDMMADKKGDVYPCVEINLRRTMGHVAIDYYDYLKNENRYYWKRQCRVSSLCSILECKS